MNLGDYIIGIVFGLAIGIPVGAFITLRWVTGLKRGLKGLR